MMTAEVISLRGDARDGEPDEEIVERLEGLLAEAKSGQLTGMAYAVTRPGDSVGTGWAGMYGTTFSLGGAILMLQLRYSEMMVHG
jgi:hypothetical protein